MAWLVLWAYHIKRLGESGNLLLLVAVITLLINPNLLRDDIGWQLSFLAVLGIIYVFPILENVADKYKISDKWRIRSIILVTLSVQATTLPVILSGFGVFSVYSPLANLLVLPVLPAVMVSIIISLFLSWLPGTLGLLIFIPAQIGLWYFNQVASLISSLPLSHLLIPEVSIIIFLIYYLIIFILTVWLRSRVVD
jgi:competence protein ComEC